MSAGTAFPQGRITLPNGEISSPWRFYFQNLYQATGGGSPNVPASKVTVTPTGSISTADAQSAFAQLDALKVPLTRTVNGHALNANISVTAADVGAPPTSRTINGHPLSADVVVTATDVGAPSGSGTSTGTNTGDQFTSETASTLIGRGDGAGAGLAQEITLGAGLLMTGTVLSSTGGGGGAGTVTSVSVVSANGLAGTVATSTTTPAITLTTTLTGLLKGNGTAMSAAVGGTDYVAPTTTVNGHALSANVTVTAADVGAPSGSGTSSGTNTGDQTITLTGDVTGSGTGSFAATIAAASVTLTKQANLAANSIIGNNTGVSATPLALTGAQVKTLLAITATDVGLGSVTNNAQTQAAIVPNTAPAAGNLLVGNAGGTAYASVASSGDVTVSSAGAFTIGAAKVTYAKMQNVSATSRILGRVTAGAGSPEELTLTQALDFVGSAANGDILSRQAGAWNRLGIGTTGQVLTVVSGVPAWGSNELQLANVTLGVAGTSLASGTITACKFLRIVIYLSGYAGSDTASLQFNGAAGTAYRYRWLTSAAGGTTDAAGLIAASTDRIKIAAANTTNSRIVECVISNDPANTEKLVKFIGSLFGTGSAGTQATEDRGNGAWVSGASTQITSVSLVSSSNMNAGTQMTIYGWN